MQVSSKVANTNKKVLYISGEESESQIKMRASRLGVNSQNLYIFAENNLSIIEAHLEKINPELIIVDSIQTVYSPEISSAPGTVSQIKEGTSKFMKISKKMGISTFIVGHVTKEGALAGPKLLEHMVDTVLYFEGERYNSYRLVRAVKNRFGSTNELGVFEMKDFYIALRNTIVLNGLDLIIGFPAPIILAILLNEIRNKYFKRISQTVLYLPHFLSWVIIAGIFYQLLSPSTGFVNVLIMRHGGESIPFLTEKWHWLVSYCLIGVWQSMGWGTIIYLAAITGINADLYEAATVDGAGRWRKIWNITLPCIRSTIVVMLIMSLGRILGISFERPYTLDNPLVRDFSDVISTFVYRVGLQSHRYNIATAVGLFQSVVGLIFVFASDKFAKLMGEDGII